MKIPKFKNEAEEARWWDKQGGRLTRVFERAAAADKLGRGTIKRRGATPTTTIRLDPDDLARVRRQAERKGLKYQTYLKMILREALLREESEMSHRSQATRRTTGSK